MKNKIRLITVLMLSFLIIGCLPQSYQVPTLAIRSTEVENQISPGITDTPVCESRFTIDATQELKEPVKVLYRAFFRGESPSFVENGGDLLITSQGEEDGFHPDPPAIFHPNGAMFPQTESQDISDFINFSLSAEGQQVLIDANFLPENITLIDQAGKVVEIELPVRRVISAYGPVTSIVYSVDAEDRFVSASYLGARDPLGSSVMDKMDPRFPAIKGDDSFSQSEFNIEEAASLNPDLILANARSSWLESAAELDIPVFLYDPETPERLKEAVFLTGQIFGPHSTAQANAWIKYFEGVLEKIGNQANNIPDEDKLDVLFTGTEPLRVVSGEMFQTFIIETVGGHSVTSDLGGYWNNVNLEQVLLWDPDVVIVPPYGGASVEAITESQEWQILNAVEEGRIYRMPKLVAPWDTPAPDAVLGVIWMGQQLYPEKYDLHCTQEAEYFYDTFFDYKITEEELATVCNFE